jgi:hypothetical protein
MSKQVWITEEEAAKKMKYHPRYLRHRVTSGQLAISYRTNDRGRNYEYDLKAIEEIKNRNAIIYS